MRFRSTATPDRTPSPRLFVPQTMRNVPLSVAFDLTQGETSAYLPEHSLTRNDTHPYRAMFQSHRRSKHRGANAQPSPSRSQLAAGARSVPTPTSIDRCLTPISQLYRAIHMICGEMDECDREFASHAVGVEGSTPRSDSRSDTRSPEPASLSKSRRPASATQDEKEGTIIYETGPKPRPLGSIPSPGGGRGATPIDAGSVNTSGGERPAFPSYRDAQGSRQNEVVSPTRRGDELVLLYRLPAHADMTLSQRSQPDPRSPLERPRVALPPHTCCPLARSDAERMGGTVHDLFADPTCAIAVLWRPTGFGASGAYPGEVSP